MSRRFDVNRLDKEELTYELKWRGIALGTVAEMRSRLALARQMERTGESLHYPPYPFTFQEDVAAITQKLDNLVVAVDALTDSSKSSSYLRLQTKLTHVLGHLDNVVCSSAEEFEVRGVLVAQALTLIDQLNTKANLVEGKCQPVPPNLCALQGGIQQLPAEVTQLPSSSFMRADPLQVSTPTPTASGSGIKPILPHKWNLKFSGERKGMSVTAFLERVEDMRRARNVSKDILLDSGIDLFEGRAYEFYQDCRNEVQSWDELALRFKEEYQPAFYSERLLEEIKRRTQGPDESIGSYMAVMSRYFQRLQCPISEEAKLTILMRNIAPMYRTHIGALEVTSIAHLKQLCKRIEQRNISTECAPHTRKGYSLEPDLAYIQLEDQLKEISLQGAPESPVERKKPQKEVVCYNCNKPGHRAIGCAEKKKLYCFGCRMEGVTKRNCPKCRAGNGCRRF